MQHGAVCTVTKAHEAAWYVLQVIRKVLAARDRWKFVIYASFAHELFRYVAGELGFRVAVNQYGIAFAVVYVCRSA